MISATRSRFTPVSVMRAARFTWSPVTRVGPVDVYMFAVANRQQVGVFAHSQFHTLVIDDPACHVESRPPTQNPVSTPVRQHDLLDQRKKFQIRLNRHLLRQIAIEAGPADAGQLSHPFYCEGALLCLPRADGLVEREAPLDIGPCPALSRRPPQALKKSFSSTFSASAGTNFVFSSRSCFSLRSSAAVIPNWRA